MASTEICYNNKNEVEIKSLSCKIIQAFDIIVTSALNLQEIDKSDNDVIKKFLKTGDLLIFTRIFTA